MKIFHQYYAINWTYVAVSYEAMYKFLYKPSPSLRSKRKNMSSAFLTEYNQDHVQERSRAILTF